MVHNKSEYRLQYHLLAKELRRKIWQENVNKRFDSRVSNQADHYWQFQLTDEPCECDCTADDKNDGPLSLLKRKHNSLVAQHSKHQDKRNCPTCGAHEATNSVETAVQTPDWKNNNVMDRRLAANTPSPDVAKPPGKQSRTPLPPATAWQIVQCPTRTTRKLHAQPKKTHFMPFGWNDDRMKTFNVTAPKNEQHIKGRLKPHELHAASMLFIFIKNIMSISLKVHEHAIEAAACRDKFIDMRLAEEAKKSKPAAKVIPEVAKNHSSIWMSEYQESFRHQQGRPSEPESAVRSTSAPHGVCRFVSLRQ